MTRPMIAVRGAERSYPNGTKALRGVDLEVPRGSRFALLGPNGAGKSTLIKILATICRPDSGCVEIDGIPLSGSSLAARSRMGAALQDVQLDPEARPVEQLALQGRLFGLSRAEAEARAGELVRRFDLAAVEGKKAKELSGGNKRRLHVALALVHRPSLVILDEPTAGMDPEIRSAFWAETRRLNEEEGVTIFFSTQYLEEAERHAEELAVLSEGRVAFRGKVADFAAEHRGENLESSYLNFLEASRG